MKNNENNIIAYVKAPRSSNLELYRIICMFLIVAHHYVVNSGVMELMNEDSSSANSIFLYIFGMWGKTAINCFLMITGYFMCTSKITLKKFLKLILWIYFYKLIIYVIFVMTGYESITIMRLFKLLMPVWGFERNFTSCFIGFWLGIPFLNILIQNMNKRQHLLLLLLSIGMNTILGSIPSFGIAMNYVTWFSIIYIIASFIRLYPETTILIKQKRITFHSTHIWLWMSLASVFSAILSVVFFVVILPRIGLSNYAYFFVSDCNKLFAVLVSVTTFLWFKNIKLNYNKNINSIGASTFGVLLIHANSNAMRQWLWKDFIDVSGHYSLPLLHIIIFSICVVSCVFIVCIIIDQFRVKYIEPFYMKLFSKILNLNIL